MIIPQNGLQEQKLTTVTIEDYSLAYTSKHTKRTTIPVYVFKNHWVWFSLSFLQPPRMLQVHFLNWKFYYPEKMGTIYYSRRDVKRIKSAIQIWSTTWTNLVLLLKCSTDTNRVRDPNSYTWHHISGRYSWRLTSSGSIQWRQIIQPSWRKKKVCYHLMITSGESFKVTPIQDSLQEKQSIYKT